MTENSETKDFKYEIVDLAGYNKTAGVFFEDLVKIFCKKCGVCVGVFKKTLHTIHSYVANAKDDNEVTLIVDEEGAVYEFYCYEYEFFIEAN